MSKKDADEGKVCAILAYLLVGIIWYFVDEKMKKNSFAKFHTKQALLLLILSIAVNIVGAIIPFIGWFIILPIGTIIVFVLWVIGLIKAISGKEDPVPIIGKYAEKWFTF